MNDKTFVGFNDADGCVGIYIKDRTKNGTKKRAIPFGLEMGFQITQSLSKADTLDILKAKFGGTLTRRVRASRGKGLLTKTIEVVYKAYLTSKAGQRIKAVLLKNKPLNPSRRKDFLIMLQLQKMVEKRVQSTKAGQVAIMSLVYKMTNQAKALTGSTVVTRKRSLRDWVKVIGPSFKELREGMRQASLIIKPIELEVSELEKALPTMKLTTNYIIGVHIGDGSFNISLSWKPTLKTTVTYPSWSISDPSLPYLAAFKNTFGFGCSTVPVGAIKGNCYQYRATGLENLSQIVALFERAKLPSYKQNQFKKFRTALNMLKRDLHQTEKGCINFVRLIYNMSENSKRKTSMIFLMFWGVKRIRSRYRKMFDKKILELREKFKIKIALANAKKAAGLLSP